MYLCTLTEYAELGKSLNRFGCAYLPNMMNQTVNILRIRVTKLNVY